MDVLQSEHIPAAHVTDIAQSLVHSGGGNRNYIPQQLLLLDLDFCNWLTP